MTMSIWVRSVSSYISLHLDITMMTDMTWQSRPTGFVNHLLNNLNFANLNRILMISRGPDINMGYYHDLFVYNVLYHTRYKITLVITVISFSLTTLPPSFYVQGSSKLISSGWLRLKADQVEEMESEIFKAPSSIGCWYLDSGVVIISSEWLLS